MPEIEEANFGSDNEHQVEEGTIDDRRNPILTVLTIMSEISSDHNND